MVPSTPLRRACAATVVALTALASEAAASHDSARARDQPAAAPERHKANIPLNHPPKWLGASWVASAYGDCTQCGFGSVQIRTVNCVAIFEEALLPEEICQNLPKPPKTKPCDCDVLPCNPILARDCPAEATYAPVDALDRFFMEMGCFKRVAGHKGPGRAGETAMDWSCIDYDGKLPCKSGVPFYSMHSNAMGPALCYDFCTSKGMDIFALVDERECRCGASAANRNIRHGKKEVPKLQFQVSVLEPFTDATGLCPLRAYRYIGHLENGGLPASMMRPLAGDVEYVDSVIAGHQMSAQEEDVGAPHLALKPEARPTSHDEKASGGKDRDLQDARGAEWNRPCYPNNCGTGYGPWKDRLTEAPAGVNDIWQEYVVVPYVFDDGLDNARKEAFRTAVVRWHEGTCVVLKEVLKVHISHPYVKVGNFSADGCWVNGLGYPGHFMGEPQYLKLNLGWCNSMFYVGSMIHEIGHALGMAHEQKRPDATGAVAGHGPHLKIHWDNIDEDWKSQYFPDPKSYVGSNYQGVGDNFHGYAPYDYESIMHYPLTDAFDPVLQEKAGLLGNRDYLSEGDLAQVNDMYQCQEKTFKAVSMSCDFELDSCDWKDLGSDAHWRVHNSAQHHETSGPERGGADTLGYFWAEVLQHPNREYIVQSPYLDITKKYRVKFKHYSSVANGKLEVDTQDVLGHLTKVWSSEGMSNGMEWKLQDLPLGKGAVAVRFVASASEDPEDPADLGRGIGLDEVDVVDDAHGLHVGTVDVLAVQGPAATKPDKGALSKLVTWFKTMLDSLFAKKYEDSRHPALRAQLGHLSTSSALSTSLAALGVAGVAATAVSVARRSRRQEGVTTFLMLSPGE